MVLFVHWIFFPPCKHRKRIQLCSFIPFLTNICRPLLWSIHRSGQPHPAHSCADDHSAHQEPHHRPECEGCEYDESALQVTSNTWGKMLVLEWCYEVITDRVFLLLIQDDWLAFMASGTPCWYLGHCFTQRTVCGSEVHHPHRRYSAENWTGL